MYQSPSIDAEGRTLQQLLEFMVKFGPRYRIWLEEQSNTPSELLTQLQRDSLLKRVCEVWESEIALGKNLVFAWQIRFASTEAPRSFEPSSYFIEDLLNIPRVIDWLQQRNHQEIIAVLQPGARLSTFLAAYYQDQLGFLPEHLEDARLPVWYVHVENLVYSLDPDDHQEQVEVRAATFACWIDLIISIFNTGRHDNIDLYDEASE